MKTKKINPIVKISAMCFLVFLLSGCFTSYHRYEKTPCDKLGPDSKEKIKKLMLENDFKEKYIALDDKSLKFTRKKVIVFSDVFKVFIMTKRKLRGKRYTIITKMKDGEKYQFITYDLETAINYYSAMECNAGIPETK